MRSGQPHAMVGTALSGWPDTLPIMKTENDARRIKAGVEIDARGIEAGAGIDARGIEAGSQAPGCAECGTALRASGPGRRPVYCGRGCSSKVYRRRRAEHQQDAVADALVTSRVELSDTEPGGEAGHHELLELAAAVQRSTARFLENLEKARRGEGDDPRCNQALALLETNLTGATQRIIRKAHVLRYEMTSTRLRTQQAGTQAPTPEPAAAPLDSPRVETDGPAAAALAPVEPAAGAGQGAAADDETGAVAGTPASRAIISPRVESSGADTAAARSTVSPRVETDQAAPAAEQSSAPAGGRHLAASVAQQPGPVDTLPQELLLALASERTSSSPLARGLGAPTDTWSIDGSDLVVEGWNSTSDLFAVRDPNRRLLGWIEALGDGWGTYIQGRLIIDATDGDPWLSTDARHAVALLRAARNQQLT
ncbi:hypothetical protein AB0D10_43760 [Kitasatospora sp. NPDC048545]|uniref:hypothetical protein n=1 Tax=Kitasatospora sp. NPDC048545 TaxID=3157208 RepID=UPI0033E5BD67